jgi:hypothetical protein
MNRMNELELRHDTIKQIRLMINYMLPNGSNYDSIINGIKRRIEMTEEQLEYMKNVTN